jgi:hypothetical protein
MSYLQNTNNDIFQQLLGMNTLKNEGGSGAMDTQKQIDECSSFEKGTPEYEACQARLKDMSEYLKTGKGLFKSNEKAESYNADGTPNFPYKP